MEIICTETKHDRPPNEQTQINISRYDGLRGLKIELRVYCQLCNNFLISNPRQYPKTAYPP